MLVYGAGVNDANYPVYVHHAGVRKQHPAYTAWVNMLKRCYSREFHLEQPSYAGCTVSPDWLYFTAFERWWSLNYKVGYELDKDILIPGNKVYSPSTCIFIPKWVNQFVVVGNSNKDYPLGVSVMPKYVRKPYRARCSCNNRTVTIGYYSTPEEAHRAWLEYKIRIVESRRLELDVIVPNLASMVINKIRLMEV